MPITLDAGSTPAWGTDYASDRRNTALFSDEVQVHDGTDREPPVPQGAGA